MKDARDPWWAAGSELRDPGPGAWVLTCTTSFPGGGCRLWNDCCGEMSQATREDAEAESSGTREQ